MTPTREVLVIVPAPDDALSRIAAVDRCVDVVDARGWFDVELRETFFNPGLITELGVPRVDIDSGATWNEVGSGSRFTGTINIAKNGTMNLAVP